MRLYRRGDVWWADFWHQGRRVRRSSGTTDETAAREWADTLKASLWRQSRLGERPAVTWDAAVLDWIEEKKDKASLADDKDRLRWLSKHLKGRRLEEISTALLTQLARNLTRAGRANGTVNRYLAAASAIVHHAHARGWVQAAPKIPYLQEPRFRLRFLEDEEEADKLIAALPVHVRPLARFALATGMRRHNVTHLEWRQVDLRRRGAWYHPDEMKAGKPLWCHFNADALEVLREQRAAIDARRKAGKLLPGEERWVFPYRGKPVHDVTTRAWHAACKAVGITERLGDFTFHDLRHTWASWHVQRGTPRDVLKELGGWQSLEMVEKYAHLAPSHVARWADNVARNRAQRKKKATKKVA